MDVREKLKYFRQTKNLTQKELGKLSKLSEAMIRQYELKLRNPKMENLEKIASALEISLVELLGTDEWEDTYNPNGKLEKEVSLIEQIQQQYGEDAVQLLQCFTELNELGKERALERISDMTSIKKYTEI